MAEIVSKISGFSLYNRCNSSFNQQKRCNNQVNGRRVSFIQRNRSVKPLLSRSLSSGNFYGRRVITGVPNLGLVKNTHRKALKIEVSIGIAKAQRWWEKGTKTNMKQVEGPHDLVESLLNAGDKLVVVDFFSPGCGGCKALHPKICQLAEMNPNVQFLQVNYEEHKSMCYALNVHVLPFFRFYRGAHGRLCSFSCTNATIKKFKDALAKHSPDRCSLGEPKGLEEKELVALSAVRDLSFTYKPKLPKPEEILAESTLTSYPPSSHPLQSKNAAGADMEEKTLVPSGR